MVDRAFKLPRHIVAAIAQGNPQAIAALENLEKNALVDTPQQLAILMQLVDFATASAAQAAMMANQLTEQQPILQPVSTPTVCDSYLSAVSDYQQNQHYLVSV